MSILTHCLLSNKAVFNDKPNNFWIEYQAFLFFPITSAFVGLGWTLFLHPRHIIRTKRYFEMVCVSIRYFAFFAMFYPVYGIFYTILLYLASFSIACNYIFINFAVSHTHLPVTNPNDFLHWVVYSSMHTTNISPNFLCNWWILTSIFKSNTICSPLCHNSDTNSYLIVLNNCSKNTISFMMYDRIGALCLIPFLTCSMLVKRIKKQKKILRIVFFVLFFYFEFYFY